MAGFASHQFDDPAWRIVKQGECERQNGRFSNAVASFTDVIQSLPGSVPVSAIVEALVCRGVALGQTGNHWAAKEDFAHAIELDSKHAFAYYNRGYSHEVLEQYRQAVDDYSRAIELKATDSDFYLRRGVCRKKLNEILDARKDFAEVRRLRSLSSKSGG